MLSFLRRARKSASAVAVAPRVFGGGFNGGPDRTLATVRNAAPAERGARLEEAGFADAALVHRAGGNMLRIFYQDSVLLGQWSTERKAVFSASKEACYQLPLETRLERLDAADQLLDRVLTGLASGVAVDGTPLRLADNDAYLTGIERFNAGLGAADPGVRVLLTAVLQPPRGLIEAPSAGTMRYKGRPYTFSSLWQKYLRVEMELARLLVRRYLGSSAGRGTNRPRAVCAFEVCNEPDYEWLPDELRIECSANPANNPLGKYVTELHLDCIPDQLLSSFTAFEPTPWGGFRTQDAEWEIRSRGTATLLEFDWGAKFDWYVKCFAELHERLSWAIRDQARRQEADVTVVSGSVTHNNIDYLCHMFRQNPNAFTHVDAIGLHPYHWVRHNIWDSQFVSADRKDDWRATTPRAYARDYCKRFDFLEEIAQLVRMGDTASSFGLAGKRLWVTEFGIPTKKMGTHNQRYREYTSFIRQRHEPELEFPSVVWEDLWDAFFTQIDRAYLERHGIEVFLFYCLRELDTPGYDLHDDDRSNLSIFSTDGRPRMQTSTYERMTGFLKSLLVQSRA